MTVTWNTLLGTCPEGRGDTSSQYNAQFGSGYIQMLRNKIVSKRLFHKVAHRISYNIAIIWPQYSQKNSHNILNYKQQNLTPI